MDQRIFSAVGEYVAGPLAPRDEALEAAIDATAAAGIPAIQVSSAQGSSFTCWRGPGTPRWPRPGSLIVADNSIRGGALVDDGAAIRPPPSCAASTRCSRPRPG